MMNDKKTENVLASGSSSSMPAVPAQESQFSPGLELLSKVLKAGFIFLAFAISVMILYFLIAGGSFRVDTTKEAVIVLKFGEIDGLYREGWHWFLPYPVNKIVRIPTGIEKISCRTFMPSDTDPLYGNTNPQSSRTPSDALVPGKDGYLLTGDNAIIHAAWEMTYRITDPLKFFERCISEETSVHSQSLTKGPDEERISLGGANVILRNLIDDAVICCSAVTMLDTAYYKKTPYENLVKQTLAKNIEALDIGITMENLTLTLVSPPATALDAFRLQQLSNATVAKVQEEARTYAVEQKNLAESEAVRITSEAENYKKRMISEVQADTDYFKQLLVEYRKNPESTLVSLYSRSLAGALTQVQDKFVIGITPGSDQEIRLKLNPEPTVKNESNEGDTKGGAK